MLAILIITLLCFVFRENILSLFETPEETYKRHVRKYHEEYNNCFTTVRSHSRKNGQSVRSHTRQIRSLPVYPSKPLALIKKENALALESKNILSDTPNSTITNPSIVNNEVPKAKMKLNARFFLALYAYRAESKLVVLTSDGELYSEFMVNLSLIKFVKEHINFDSFVENSFAFDKNVHFTIPYQPLKEISLNQSLNYKLTNQKNWISSYLSHKGIIVEQHESEASSVKGV